MKAPTIRMNWSVATTWWQGRSRREQVLLAVLGGIAVLALFLVAIVRPLQTVRAQAKADIRNYDMIALRLAGGAPTARAPGGSPATAVSRSAATAGVAVQRVEPEGARLRVVLGDASFDAVARFVADLEKTSGLRVAEARIERASLGAGGVSASFLLTGG